MNTPIESEPMIPETPDPPVPDQINNISQKEKAMLARGLKREKYIQVIVDALGAEKMGDIEHPNGNITRGLIPDMTRRQWGAEMAAKMFGDMIERKEIEHDIGDRTLERFKNMSVEELRERLRENSRDILRARIIDVKPIDDQELEDD